MRFLSSSLLCLILAALSSCGTGDFSSGSYGPSNMGGPSPEVRRAQIAAEPTGNFYYGRRYYVQKTRWWGYLRKPRQNPNQAKLVIFNESKRRNPDRFPENGIGNKRYGFDNNYAYRIHGYYTGRKVYEVNSNQFLPEFMLTGYQLLNAHPGWLFSPKDHYNPKSMTLRPALSTSF